MRSQVIQFTVLFTLHGILVEDTEHVDLFLHVLAEFEAKALTDPQLQHVIVHSLFLLPENVGRLLH